jgi:outer membrane protein assembly factor BamA
MYRKAVLPLGLLAAICGLWLVTPIAGQVPSALKRCSTSSPAKGRSFSMLLPVVKPTDRIPQHKVVIERIDFESPIHLPASVVEGIVAYANNAQWDADTFDWLDVLDEIGLRSAWQDRGYVNAKAIAEGRLVSEDSSEKRFVVTAHVYEGAQYHLGDLSFVSNKPDDAQPFTESQLRDAFPLREGDLFSTGQTRRGIERLTKLYWSQGYVDVTVTPEIKLDENLQRVSLVLKLDEEKQYRVRNVEVVGLDSGARAGLKAPIRTGDAFSEDSVRNFLAANQSLLPPDESIEDVGILRNRQAAAVDLMFDFRPCSSLQ